MRFTILSALLIAISFSANAQSRLPQSYKFNPDRDNENILQSIQSTNDLVEYTEAEDSRQTTPRSFSNPPCVSFKNINAYPLFVNEILQSKVQSMLYNQQLQYSSERILNIVNNKSLFATDKCDCRL